MHLCVGNWGLSVNQNNKLFHIVIRPGTNSSVLYNWAVDGSWIIMQNLSDCSGECQITVELGHRTEWTGCFFCIYLFFYFLFMTLYTSTVCIYYILHIAYFSESPIYMHLYNHCLYVYIYVYMHIYIYTYCLSLRTLFLQEKLLPAFWPKGVKINLQNSIHLRISVMVAAKNKEEEKKKNSKARWKSSMKELHYLETVCDPVN